MGAQFVLEDIKASGDISEIWDFGSGNGFPGAIFSILEPKLGVICVESDERKASFLRQLAMRLELDTLGVRHQRVENLPAASIEVASSRGFASLGHSLVLTAKQFPEGGVFYNLKGSEWDSEIKALPGKTSAIWKTGLLKEYRLNPGKKGDEKSFPLRAVIKSVRKSPEGL
jgi:16S rRNA (guanine527-N7)-methyltransferase